MLCPPNLVEDRSLGPDIQAIWGHRLRKLGKVRNKRTPTRRCIVKEVLFLGKGPVEVAADASLWQGGRGDALADGSASE